MGFKGRARRLVDGSLACALPGGLGLAPALIAVDGYLFPHEAVFLYWLARSAPGAGAIVEVGSYRGRSAICLAAGVRGRRSTRIHAVDPHVYGTEEILRANLRRFDAESRVEVIATPSIHVGSEWRAPIRLLFIDGDHDEGGVQADVLVWTPHLEPGGFLLLHDAAGPGAFPGPRAVARKRLVVGDEFDATGEIGSIRWARRAGAKEPWDPPLWGRKTLDPLIRLLKRGPEPSPRS